MMLGRNGIVLALCVLFVTGTAHGFTTAELENYRVFVDAHIQGVSTGFGSDSAHAENIFYMGADEQEWEQLEALLDLYFDGLTEENHRRRFDRLKIILEIYGITIRRVIPIALYHIERDDVVIDTSLFLHTANPVYTKSLVYHEKVHQKQNRYFDREILRVDQRQKYAQKVEEIAAHYLQIRYAMESGDREALKMVLKNSARWNMGPEILRVYPSDDEVVMVVRQYLSNSGEETPEHTPEMISRNRASEF